ncbi:MAG: MBL fold metallo-hydrolase [DPANN group archaeon]|nr:MBL fold metallo-hydrolase [DPANN group archaeon]
MKYKNINIEWLGHATFKINTERGLVIYTDPFNIKNGEQADIILITHDHYDHAERESMNVIVKEGTTIIGPTPCLKSGYSVKPISNGEEKKIENIKITSIPAYNISKSYHPKENEWVGFIIDINGTKIYQAGDTDRIPEMQNIGNIDIAILPIGGTFTMDEVEASKAVSDICPKIVIPMHYGTVEGTKGDPEKFKELVIKDNPGVEVWIF